MKQEKFTDKKNREGRAALEERIRREYLEQNVDLDITEEQFLKALTLGEEVNRTLIEVTVSTDVIPEPARETLNYLLHVACDV